jgi:type IV pilus assembly protein PilV
MNKLNKQQGFTLMEVMVALFILTIGMLGSTSMMLRSQQKAAETNIEINAAQRVWNITEILRSNITGVNAGTLDGLVVTTASAPPVCMSSLAGGCAAGGEMTGMISYLIGMELDTYLANKNPQVEILNTSGINEDAVYEVSLTWEELDKDGNTYEKDYTMMFQP